MLGVVSARQAGLSFLTLRIGQLRRECCKLVGWQVDYKSIRFRDQCIECVSFCLVAARFRHLVSNFSLTFEPFQESGGIDIHPYGCLERWVVLDMLAVELERLDFIRDIFPTFS